MIRLRPSGVDEVLIKRVQDWYEPGPGVFIQSLTASFSPAMLFTGSTVGAWYDPSDYSTLFQDAAGTTPVTAVEQPVGLMKDKSGKGNHAFNSSGNSANFPVLSARYNLLTKTEAFDDGVWTKVNAVITANAATAPDGTLTADRLVGSGGWYTQQSVNLATGVSYTVSCYVKSNTGVLQTFRLYGSNSITSSDLTATTEWKRFTFSFTATLGDGHGIARNTAGDPNDLLVWGADLRVANDALNQPAYQRVNTATDYDTVGFKPYLRFNGTNQWLQTNSIDFTYGDKMFVSAGVRKLSDAQAVIAELSVNVNSNNSVFGLFTGFPVSTSYQFYSKGTLGVDANITITSPVTNVVSGIGNISGDQSILRVNGTQAAISTADQGTGNYGNYPLYMGARAGTSLWANIRFYGAVIAGKQASAAEITNTETFINQKTGAY